MAAHSSVLAWRILGMGSHRVGHDWSDLAVAVAAGQEEIPSKKWSSPHSQQLVRNAVLGCNLKNARMIAVCFQGKRFNITVIQDYAPTTNAKEAEVEWFYEDLQDLLELIPKKKMSFSS